MIKFIALFLFINIICSAASVAHVPVAPDECVLARSLSQWLGVKVTIDGQNLRFSEEQTKLAAAIAKLRDFDQIRREFLPVNHGAAAIRSVAKPLGSWEECFGILGIDPTSVLLFNLQGTKDIAGEQLMIPAGDDFNGSVADLYVKALMKNSIFFKWVADNFKEQFIARVDSAEGASLAIRYGLLTQFLYLGKIAIRSNEGKYDEDDVQAEDADCFIPIQTVLKTLVAAGSGNVSLKQISVDKFNVQFVSLGNEAGSSYPTVEFVLDTSYSMSDEIAIINRTMPKLLQQLSSSFPKIRVRIFSFNDAKKLEAEYDLEKNQPVPVFRDLITSGSTNLGHIVRSIPLKEDEQSKTVVAFTDGRHESNESLDFAFEALKAAQIKGRFALPRLFRVGLGSKESEKFFKDMAAAMSGFSSYSDSIEAFCQDLVKDIADISRPRSALSLQREGLTVSVNWIPVDRPGLFKTSAMVIKDGDSIVDRHGSHVVSLPNAAAQIVVPVLDAAAAKRAAREKLLAEQRRLAEELAALGDDD